MPAATATATPPTSASVPMSLSSHHHASNGNGTSNGTSNGNNNGNGNTSSGTAASGQAKNTSHVPCKFFRQNACQAGNSCPFSHSLDPIPPCKYFLKGNCKFGSKCANQHMIMDRRRPSLGAAGGSSPSSSSQNQAHSPPQVSSTSTNHNNNNNLSSPLIRPSRVHAASPVTPSLLSIHARHGHLGPHPSPARSIGSGAGLGVESPAGYHNHNGGIGAGAGSYDPYDNRMGYNRSIPASAPHYGIDIRSRFPRSPPTDSASFGTWGKDSSSTVGMDSPRLAARVAAAGMSSPPSGTGVGRAAMSVGLDRDRFAASQHAFLSASVGSTQPGSFGIPSSLLMNLSSGKHLIAMESAGADSDIDEILLNQEAAAAAASVGLPEFDDLDSAVLDDYDSDTEFRAEAFGVRRGSLLAIPLTPTSRTSFSSFTSARHSSTFNRPALSPRTAVPISGSARSVSLSTPLSAARYGYGGGPTSGGGTVAIPLNGGGGGGGHGNPNSLRIGSPGAPSPIGMSAGSPSRFSQFFARPEGLGPAAPIHGMGGISAAANINPSSFTAGSISTASTSTLTAMSPTMGSGTSSFSNTTTATTVPISTASPTPARATPSSLRVGSAVVGSPLRNQQFPSSALSVLNPTSLNVSKLAISTTMFGDSGKADRDDEQPETDSENDEDDDNDDADSDGLGVGIRSSAPSKRDRDDCRSRSTDEEGTVFDME